MNLPFIKWLARSAGCHENGSPSATEAFRRKSRRSNELAAVVRQKLNAPLEQFRNSIR
jgi:hypothetical protein